MATLAASPGVRAPRKDFAHHVRLALVVAAAAGLILYLAAYGYSYYNTSLEDRPYSPLHAQLRPSGTIGLKLGILGVALFGVLFLHPIRKRWRWLGRIGLTKHWLDFHVVAGITAPVVITFHTSFKMGGLAGLAYWIMVIVALSGFVGRYVYAKIPRSINYVQLTMAELEVQTSAFAARLSDQDLFQAEDLAPLLSVPSRQDIRTMNLVRLVGTMLSMDLRRPWLVSALRRRVLHGMELWTTFGGFLASRHEDLESVIQGVRRQSRLLAKTAFLDRTLRIFHLWHVVHRPFSMSFVVLVIVHVTVVQLVGHR